MTLDDEDVRKLETLAFLAGYAPGSWPCGNCDDRIRWSEDLGIFVCPECGATDVYGVYFPVEHRATSVSTLVRDLIRKAHASSKRFDLPRLHALYLSNPSEERTD